MYVLIGVKNEVYQDRIDEPFQDHYSDENVALFTSRELGEEYIEKSKLKKPKRKSFSFIKRFKSSSLLSPYEEARIEEYYEEELPINPKI